MSILDGSLTSRSTTQENERLEERNAVIGKVSMRDFCVEHDGSPNTVELIGEMLGAAGVNIEGLCLITQWKML